MGHVVKAKRIRLDEPLRLSIDGTGTLAHSGSHRPGMQPRVRVAESNAEFAVLEIMCTCGRVTHVRCEYAAAGVTTPSQSPAQP